MALILPSWFKQRQGKAEKLADEHTYRLSAPQLADAFISIRTGDNSLWSATLRANEAGPDVAATGPTYKTETEAWEAAFELYRQDIVM
jgi:hypothetical protein